MAQPGAQAVWPASPSSHPGSRLLWVRGTLPQVTEVQSWPGLLPSGGLPRYRACSLDNEQDRLGTVNHGWQVAGGQV